MTIIEIIWWIFVGLGIAITIFGLTVDDGDTAFGGIGFILIWSLIALVSSPISSLTTPYKITSQHVTIPLSKTKTSIGYVIVTYDSNSYTYTDYKDVAAIENGCKFYKTYYFKKVNFGMDDKKFDLIIKP